jgi:hypothetical protein
MSVGYAYIMERMDFFYLRGYEELHASLSSSLHERRLERKPTARQGADHDLHALERIHERSLVKKNHHDKNIQTSVHIISSGYRTPTPEEVRTNLVFIVDFLHTHAS